MSTGNTETDITLDEVDYIDDKGTCWRKVGEGTGVDEQGQSVAQYEPITLPGVPRWTSRGYGKGRRKTKISEMSELDQERIRTIRAYDPSAASGESYSTQQAGMTSEQMMQFDNSLTPEQLQSYGGYGTQYGGNSSKTLPSQQEMEMLGQVYDETMSNQASSMASYDPELDEGSALAQQYMEIWGESYEIGNKKRSKK
ncbi:hypothetical protein B9479_008134 [Cryptococcus floricola]|uniref:Uncharacterized protein n=1 Tax=Cryptococcus floricola TaxID=2591691 RepID=A0A5D3AKH3_9TREE|nr:hypothetical protein B9479_008134 [Cryptococcus floricola]